MDASMMTMGQYEEAEPTLAAGLFNGRFTWCLGTTPNRGVWLWLGARDAPCICV